MENTTTQGGVLKAPFRIKGGASVPHYKNTSEQETVRMPVPEKVVLPMQQHIGAPCIPLVKVGDIVEVGQKIGDSDSFVSAPIHASISGKVTAIREITICNGNRVQAVEIESDGEMRPYAGIQPPKVETVEDFLKAVRESGLAGLGGAGFPTHVKLSPPKGKTIDTLIVNAAECEPFITVDYRECMENSWDILSGVYAVKEILGIENGIIAVEDNKVKAIEVLAEIAANKADVGDHVRVMSLKTRYPQGAEKVLVQATTGRRIPMGKLPADVGCLVMNVGSIAFLARYLKSGKPLVSRTLTVDGRAIAERKNVRAPLGTSVQDIIDFCGGFKKPPQKLLFGGPMMGIAFSDLTHPILKNNNAILAFDKSQCKEKTVRPCIRCGRCSQACPMGLMPTLITRFAKINAAEDLERIGVSVCMECGSCAYSCPSARPLVQYMRQAKAVVRNAKK